MRRSIAILILLVGVLTACSPFASTPPRVVRRVIPTATPAPPPPPPPTAVPTPAPPPTIALDTTEVKRQLLAVEADAAKMRGLKPKRPVPEHFVAQAELKYTMGQQTLQEYTPEMAHRDATRLWLLLLIDNRSTDFRQMEVDFAGQEVLGYYDQMKKELFVRTDGSSLSPRSKETLAHEFVHNLQDQYFNLQKLLPPGIDHDREMAVRALVEGDATVSGIFYAARYMSNRDFSQVFAESEDEIAPPVPGRAPVYLQQGWQFPYRYGSEFVLALSPPGSYKAINAAFANPPDSTEQIMHPQKFLAKKRDEPLPVPLPPLTDTLGTLGAGWTFQETDTLGEFDLQVMLLENYVKNPQASEGWGGARYALYTKGEDALTIMGSRWDTKRDLGEWEDGLVQSFKLFHKEGALWSDRGRFFGEKRSGDQVVFVDGTDGPTVQRVLDSLKP